MFQPKGIRNNHRSGHAAKDAIFFAIFAILWSLIAMFFFGFSRTSVIFFEAVCAISPVFVLVYWLLNKWKTAAEKRELQLWLDERK